MAFSVNLHPKPQCLLKLALFTPTAPQGKCYNLYMKKLLKWLCILAALAVVLLIAALITLKIMFPPEKLKSMAQSYAQQTLNREVTFNDVSLNLVGITLQDFAISEKGTFADGTFAKADKAVVKIALKPLFKKRIEISTVGLEGLDLTVSKNKDGVFNFDDLMSASTAQEQPQESEEASSSSFVLLAQRIYATDCNLHYKDDQLGINTSITHLNLEITGFNLDDAFDITLSFTTDYQDKAGLTASIPLKARLQANLAGLDMAKAQVTLNSLSLTYKGIGLSLWGGAKNLNAPIIDLTGKITDVSNTALSDILPDLPAFVLPDILFSASAEANLDASTATLKQAKLSLSDSAITLKGQAGWGGTTPTYNATADININMQQVAQMAQMLSGYGIGGSITGNLTATDKNNGQDLRGTISLKDLTLQYDPLTLSNMTGDIVIKSLADISCASLTGLLNQEKFSTSFAYKDLGSVLDLALDFDLAKLTLDRFPSFGEETADNAAENTSSTSLATDGPETLFNVRANINLGPITVPYFTTQGVSLKADLTKASATMKTASGSASFTLKEGAITDLDQFVRENRIVKILMLPLSLVKKVTATLGLDIFPQENEQKKGQIAFSSGSGAYAFTNGVMNIQQTRFNSSVSNIEASGNINFKTEALDMRVSASVLTAQTPVVIKIGGTMSEPSGKLDVAGTATSLVKGLLNPKTATDAVTGTGNAAKAVVNKTADIGANAVEVGTNAVKDTVGAATNVVKGIGSLFKSKDKKETEKK